MQKFSAIVATYGTSNLQGDILSHQAALQLFDQLRQQETVKVAVPGYHISDVRIEGDNEQGRIIATFSKVEGRTEEFIEF